MQGIRVCVTGGGGYQASWLVKLLLFKGYIVHATVRDPDNEKNAHLKTLENAQANLRLFKAELLDYDGLFAAIEGCNGVFHVASPVQQDTTSDPEMEIVKPAVTGTSNVLKACSMANVKRVVVVSSIGAVMCNPNWPKGKPMDESSWSGKEASKTAEARGYKWYCISKTIAETHAVEYGKTTGLDVVTVCPSSIIGPILQSAMTGTGMYIYMLLIDGLKPLENKLEMLVDVRDVAEALLLVYEKPEAKGRYICSSYSIMIQDLVHKLKNMYPHYNLPKQVTNVDDDYQDITSEKLQNLGWRYRSLEDTIVDSVHNYQEKGILQYSTTS